jgi:hypothetical protein
MRALGSGYDNLGNITQDHSQAAWPHGGNPVLACRRARFRRRMGRGGQRQGRPEHHWLPRRQRLVIMLGMLREEDEIPRQYFYEWAGGKLKPLCVS